MKNVVSILLLVVLFQGVFASSATSNGGEEKHIKIVSFEELNNIDSHDFIEILKESPLVYIVEDKSNPRKNLNFIVKDWPKKEDVPYLLSISESDDPCGRIWSYSFSVDPDWGFSEQSTIGEVALQLLDAIRKREFRIGFAYVSPENRQEIIEWARKEIETLNATKP